MTARPVKTYFEDLAPSTRSSIPRPAMARLNDLPLFETELFAAAKQHDVPYELVVAQSYQESQWTLKAYRYEPGYDRRYISRTTRKLHENIAPATFWAKDTSWLAQGPTAQEWFAAHPRRATEIVPNVSYGFVAQTKIAASHGPMQMMLPTARRLGFDGPPEGLYTPVGARLGVFFLDDFNDRARAKGFSEKESLMIALATYNGGALGNTDPKDLRNIDYVRLVEKRYQACWGTPFFGAI